MAVYNIVPADYIKAKIISDFRPNDNFWTTNLNIWIGEAIQGIGTYAAMGKKHTEVEVKNGRARLPCAFEGLLYMEHNNKRIPLAGSVRNAMQGERFGIGNGYVASPGYIHCPFNEGTINFYHTTIPVQENGDGTETPMVIDAFEYKEAVAWFCMMKMLSTGYEHKVHNFKDAREMWETHRDAARYHAKQFTADELELFGRMWTNKFAANSGFYESFGATNDVRPGNDTSGWRKQPNIFDELRENGVNLED